MEPQRVKQRRIDPPRDAVRIHSARGSFAFWQLRPNVYLTEVSGYMTPDMSRTIIECAEPLYAQGKLYGFHNWLDMSNYDSACRVELTAWVLRHRRASVLHIALLSRMVAMGVTVANLALGNLIHIHNDSAGLEASLDGVLRDHG